MCAIERVEKLEKLENLERLVAALGRRVLVRQAEYEASHAAWLRNRERWSGLEDESCARLRAECRAESQRLDARCRRLNGRMKVLNQLLWAAETALAEAQAEVAEQSAALLTFHALHGTAAKFSPPGRPACAESGCLKAIVYPSEKSEETGWLTRSTGGNRVGFLKERRAHA